MKPKFKKGDEVVHTHTGIPYTVMKTRKKCLHGWDTHIASFGGFSQWMNSEYYTLRSVFESPLYKALAEK